MYNKICRTCGRSYSEDFCPNCASIADQDTTSFTPVGARGQSPNNLNAEVRTTKPSLLVVKGPQMGYDFLLNDGVTTIGRDPKADIFLNDRTVSRKHATLTQVSGTVILQDQGSLNGTYVNNELVDEAELRAGDQIQFGTFLLMFHKD